MVPVGKITRVRTAVLSNDMTSDLYMEVVQAKNETERKAAFAKGSATIVKVTAWGEVQMRSL